MGLGFAKAGDFKPYVSYNAKAGKLSQKKDGVDTDINLPVSFVADFANIKTGWYYYATGQAPQVVHNPSLSVKAPRPAGDGADGKPLYKEGFTVDFFSNATFGGVVEFSSSSMLVREAINVLYTAYEAGVADNKGMLPVVELTGTTKVVGKHGQNYSPNFKITKWVVRPAEFDTAQPANQSSAAAVTPPAQKAVSEF